jgi:hypothetical protein
MRLVIWSEIRNGCLLLFFYWTQPVERSLSLELKFKKTACKLVQISVGCLLGSCSLFLCMPYILCHYPVQARWCNNSIKNFNIRTMHLYIHICVGILVFVMGLLIHLYLCFDDVILAASSEFGKPRPSSSSSIHSIHICVDLNSSCL